MSDETLFSNGDQDEELDSFTNYLQERYEAMEGVVNAINAEFECNLRLTCEACPVLIEGTVDGLELYFRARWDSWRLGIALTVEDAAFPTEQSRAAFYSELSTELGEFGASWLEPAEVDQALRACLISFRAGNTNVGTSKGQ